MAQTAFDYSKKRSNAAGVGDEQEPNGQTARDGDVRPYRRDRQPHARRRSTCDIAALSGANAGRARRSAGHAPAQPDDATHAPDRRRCDIRRAMSHDSRGRPRRRGLAGNAAIRTARSPRGNGTGALRSSLCRAPRSTHFSRSIPR